MQVMRPYFHATNESRPPAMSNTKNTLSGIDLNAPGALAALFEFHRSLFGDATMQDPASTDGTNPDGATGDPVTPPAGTDGTPPVEPPAAPVTPPVTPPAADPVTPPVTPPVEPVTPPVQPAADAAKDGDDDEDDTPEGKSITDLPNWAQKQLTRARNQAAERRSTIQALEASAKEMAGVLGLTVDADKGIDTSAVLDGVKALKQSFNDLKIDNALTAAIAEVGADPMTRSVALGERRLENLDPSAADFTDKVTAAIQETIAKYPSLKTTQAVGSSLDLSGNSPLGAITAAQFNAMSLSEKFELSVKNPTLYAQLRDS